MPYQTINPTTGEASESIAELSSEAVDARIANSVRAWQSWRDMSFEARATVLRSIADSLRGNGDYHAEIMAREMGKPLADGKSEAEKCAWVCEHYAQRAKEFLASETISTEAKKSYVRYESLGPILAIMPWNFPYWQLFRFAAPALMAGNSILLKHAPNVPECAQAIETTFSDSDAPKLLVQNCFLSNAMVAEAIADFRVRGVTLTGSTRAGRAVASQAGQHLKRTVLELGGSDPYLILGDADVPLAARLCVQSRMLNGGQSCIAAKRFIALDSVYDDFVEAVVECMKSYTMGDPMNSDTTLGPQARHDLRDALHGQVEKSIQSGARLLIGGEVPDGPGAFYPPTVLVDVGPDAPAYSEELFGPVATILRAENEKEAIRIANDTAYGLGSAIFSRDLDRAEALARQLQAGSCFINDFVKSDPRLPFGGIRDSGYGRELGRHGIHEFVNAKTISIA